MKVKKVPWEKWVELNHRNVECDKCGCLASLHYAYSQGCMELNHRIGCKKECLQFVYDELEDLISKLRDNEKTN